MPTGVFGLSCSGAKPCVHLCALGTVSLRQCGGCKAVSDCKLTEVGTLRPACRLRRVSAAEPRGCGYPGTRMSAACVGQTKLATCHQQHEFIPNSRVERHIYPSSKIREK